LIAFIIPARPRKGPRHFIRKIKELLTYFERRKEETPLILQDEKQHELLEEMQEVTMQATTPLQWWQTKLQLPVALIVLPIFALVNAGIPINVTLFDKVFTNRVSIGIMLGLVIGKPLGVLLFSRIALWFKLGTLPSNTTFRDLYYVAFLTGIGFTMSLFIAHLSFQPNTDPALLAKGGVLMSSLIASIIGIVLLIFKKPV